ncbi:MAG TPA: hypothetical protein VNN08_24865 [Thermoanaerobaculia bacterium]|nr:hypothetical protein [Thermoanaerobaculia bacterium]
MKTMNLKNSLTASIVLASLLVAGSAVAQNLVAGPPVPCPHPVSLTLNGPSRPPTPPAPDPLDFAPTLTAAVTGSQWNQTAVNKSFGHTFHFPATTVNECCLMTKGTLQVKVKCLQTGGANSSTSGNDDIELVQHGAPVSGFSKRVWPQPAGCVAGAVTTVTFNNIPVAVLSTGRVSFFVEDDTAVISATLILNGCCLR